MGGAPSIPGFRLGPAVSHDRGGVVHDAVQAGLERPAVVELVVPDAGDPATAPEAVEEAARRQALLRHPAIATVYAAGRWEGGAYLARRRLDDGDRLTGRGAGPERVERLGEALDAAHDAGLVHGALHELAARDEACLTRLVLADERRTPQADREAFAQLAAGLARRRGGRRRAAAAGLAAAAAAGAVAVALAGGGESEGERAAHVTAPAPPRAAGSTSVGAALVPGPVRTSDCDGRPPAPNSPACSIVPLRAGREELAVGAAGVVRRWAVRGARGTLALQAVRRGADGRWREAGRSQYVRVPGPGPHAFAADMPVRRGDRLGVELTPGAGIGLSPRRGTARTLRFAGPLEVIRAPRVATTTLPAGGAEVLLRADVLPGASPRPVPGRLTGAEAARAPEGRPLGDLEIEQPGGRLVRLVLVALGDAVAVDLIAGGRRTVRLPLAGLRSDGRLFNGLEIGFVSSTLVRVQWRNPGRGPVVVHDVVVRSGTLRLVT